MSKHIKAIDKVNLSMLCVPTSKFLPGVASHMLNSDGLYLSFSCLLFR